MVSLASYNTLYITAVRTLGADRLESIIAVRFDGGYTGAEESSVADLVRRLGRSDVRASIFGDPMVAVDPRSW